MTDADVLAYMDVDLSTGLEGLYPLVARSGPGARRPGRNREQNLEEQAALGTSGGSNLAAMRMRDRPDDREAEPPALAVTESIGPESAKRLEEPVDFRVSHLGPVVGHTQNGVAPLHARHGLDPTTRAVVSRGVVDEVRRQPLDEAAVPG
jgi:hypothetical protein